MAFKEGRRNGMRRPGIGTFQMRLRAGVPQPIVAQIGSRRGIVGTISLHAVGDRVITPRRRSGRNNGAIVGVLVIIIARPVISRPAVIGIAVCRQRTADHRTGHHAGDEAAVAVVVVIAVMEAAISAAIRAAIILRDRRRAYAGSAVARTRAGNLPDGSAYATRAKAGTGSVKLRGWCAYATRVEGSISATESRGRRPAAAHRDGPTSVILGEACRRRGHWQNHGHDGSGTQDSWIDHCRLHLRDGIQPSERADVPALRLQLCARSSCQSGTVCGMNRYLPGPRQTVTRARPADFPRYIGFSCPALPRPPPPPIPPPPSTPPPSA